jgi:hypothetical protein
VFPPQDIVTEFHDLSADVVPTVKDAKGDERKLPLPGAPGNRKNIVWRAPKVQSGAPDVYCQNQTAGV